MTYRQIGDQVCAQSQKRIGRKDQAPFGCRTKFSITGSMSVVERTESSVAATPSDALAFSMARMKNLDCGEVSGLNMTPTRAIAGAISLRGPSHLPPTANSNALNPVRLPPGLARLATKPCSTGSDTCVNTTGR